MAVAGQTNKKKHKKINTKEKNKKND